MGKLDNLERLQKLKEAGAISAQDFEKEKDKILNSKISKKIKILLLILTIIVVGGIIIILLNKNTGIVNFSQKTNSITEIQGTNNKIANLSQLSFNNMKSKSDDLNLNNAQQEILNYFDNDYFNINVLDFSHLERYPSVYKNAKVSLYCRVVKVIKSTAEDYEVLVYPDSDGYGPTANIDELDNSLILIKGKQLTERILKDDLISVYGKYIDVETIEVDGKSYTIPAIEVKEVADFNSRFDIDTIRTVAKYIFGENIKIRKGISAYASEEPDSYLVGLNFYVATLDNQSNGNFKAFNFCDSYGYIEYNCRAHNLPDTVVKKLFISADFQHYIVSTFDSGTEHIYIEYFDKELKKIWSREFDYNSNSQTDLSPMDYTANKMAVVIDNDLHIIDINTGENVIEPVLVGEKIRVVMLKDSVLMIGNNNKDAIMRVDYKGNIIQKENAETEMSEITEAQIQQIDDRIVIRLTGQPREETPYLTISKYIVLDKKCNIEISTEDR